MHRLIKNAFYDEPRNLSSEVKCGPYSIDIVLDLKDRKIFNLAIEITNKKTKFFRTASPSVYEIIRSKFLKLKGYKEIDIDTTDF